MASSVTRVTATEQDRGAEVSEARVGDRSRPRDGGRSVGALRQGRVSPLPVRLAVKSGRVSPFPSA